MSAGFTQSDTGAPVGLSAGDVLGGKYRVDRIIGEGGMGFVVAATHLHLEEQVAIKLLLPEAVRSPDVVKRFLSEAKAAVRIKSEHVARVTDVGTLDSGAPFMVMEYLHGSDLADSIEKNGPVNVEAAVEYVLQACEAIAEAHAAGIIHRDLKPANLFLTRRADGSPCVKVLDFGISKIEGGSHAKTKTSAVMGSPAYMSPEQMRSSKDVDARTDIWALGAILYELLAGAPPFDAETVPQLCMKIVHDPTPSIAAARADVPAGLEAVIHRSLEKDPAARFGHIGELAEALAPFAVGRARLSVDRVAEIARAAGLAGRVSGAPSRPSSSSGATVPAAPANLGAAATMLAGSPEAAATSGSTGSTSGMWNGSLEQAKAEPAPRKKGAAPIAAAVAAFVVLGGGAFALFAVGGSGPGEGPAPSAEAAHTSAVIAPPAPPAPPTEKAASPLGAPAEVATDSPAVVPHAAPSAAPSLEPTATKPAAPPGPARPPGQGAAPPGPGKPGPKPTGKPPTPPKSGVDLFNDRQ